MAETSELLRNIGQVGRELSVAFDLHLRDLNLTTARARVLLLLQRNDSEVSQAAVTEHLRVEHPTAVRILDGLETLGYIQRVPSPDDRRARMIIFTIEGRAVAKKLATIVSTLNDRLIDRLDPTEAETANRVLLRILAGIQTLKTSAAITPVEEQTLS